MQASLSLGWRKLQFFSSNLGGKCGMHFTYNLGPLVATCYKEISTFGYPFLQGIGGRVYLSQCLAVLDSLF